MTSASIAAVEAADARIEAGFKEEFRMTRDNMRMGIEWAAWAMRHCPSVKPEIMDDGSISISGDREEVEAYAEKLCSEHGCRQVDAYADEVPGSGQQYYVIELEKGK